MTPLLLIKFSLFAALLCAAAAFDLRERRIPNVLTMSGLAAGVVMGVLIEGGWPGAALAGAALGLIVSFPLFAMGAIGAGDAKLFAAVGAFLGPVGLFMAALYGALAGGILGLVTAARRGALTSILAGTRELVLYLVTLGRRGARVHLASPDAVTVPYGVAIAAGALMSWFFPTLPGGLS